jgi:ATP-binding cassette subfamily A (ABC1) protein 3
MDEADYLGDRIAIMGEGKVMTCGTSLFLKQKHGVGYSLNVKFKTQNSFKPFESYIKGLIADAEPLVGGEFEAVYKLPLDQAHKFQELFSTLKSRKDDFNIDEYGISVTTLEEVFLKVAAGIEAIKPDMGSEKSRKVFPIDAIDVDQN